LSIAVDPENAADYYGADKPPDRAAFYPFHSIELLTLSFEASANQETRSLSNDKLESSGPQIGGGVAVADGKGGSPWDWHIDGPGVRRQRLTGPLFRVYCQL